MEYGLPFLASLLLLAAQAPNHQQPPFARGALCLRTLAGLSPSTRLGRGGSEWSTDASIRSAAPPTHPSGFNFTGLIVNGTAIPGGTAPQPPS